MSESTEDTTSIVKQILESLTESITHLVEKKVKEVRIIPEKWPSELASQELITDSITPQTAEKTSTIPVGWEPEIHKIESEILSHQELVSMEKALRHIIGAAEFRPETEEQLDDKFQAWSLQLLRAGYSKRVIMHALYNTLAESYKTRLPMDILTGGDFTRFWDQCASRLFPLSRQTAKILSRILGEQSRSSSLKVALKEYEKDKARYAILIRRYPGDLPTLTDRRWIECLSKKLPLSIYKQSQLLMQTPNISLEQVEIQLRSLETEEAEEPIIVNPILSKQIRGSDGRTTQVKEFIPHPDGPLCHNCGQRGHMSPNCQLPRKKCNNCGRIGHKAEYCRTMQLERRYGPDLRIAAQGTRAGIKITARQDQDHETYLRTQAIESQKQAERLATIKDKAKVRHKTNRALEKSYWAEHPEEARNYHKKAEIRTIAPTPSTPGRGKRTTRSASSLPQGDDDVPIAHPTSIVFNDEITQPYHPINPLPLRRFMTVDIEGLPLEVLIDSGAQVSILRESTLKMLPKDVQSNFRRSSIAVDGIGGHIKCLGQLEANVRIGKTITNEIFWIIPEGKGSVDLLGDTFLKPLEGIINCGTDELQLGNEVMTLQQKGAMTYIKVAVCEAGTTPIPIIGEDLTGQQPEKLQQILQRYHKTWKEPKLGQCKVLPFKIDTGDAKPRASPPRAISLIKQELIEKTVKELFNSGAIIPSHSPWSSATVLVKKKNGESRMCIDYRPLNEVTKRDVFPLPRIDTLLSRMGNAKYFSTIDLYKGYHQLTIDEESREKTAFITNSGLYEYTVLPFGLANAPPFFQRVMQEVLKGLLWENVLVYLDDIIIFTSDWDRHLYMLEEVLKKLEKAGLYLNLKKSRFGMQNITYLGYIISNGTMYPDPSKLAPLQQCPTPTNVSELRSFLGLAGYFRKFIVDYATLTKALYTLLRKETDWSWKEEHELIFNKIKTKLCSAPIVLYLPRWDCPFILDTDASTIAVAAVLQQEVENGDLKVIAYASRALTDGEKKWSTRELEAFAIVWGIYHFEQYLDGRKFTVRTDHESLKWLWSSTGPARVARWALALQYFDFKIIYRCGKKQTHVDYFSRNLPITDEEDKLTDLIAARPTVFQLFIDVDEADEEPEMKRMRLDNYNSEEKNDTYNLKEWPFPPPSEFQKAQEEEEAAGTIPSVLKIKGKLAESTSGKIYVPGRLRRVVMYHFHYARTGQHAGVNRMYRSIVKRFWWPYLKTSLQEYVSECLTCLRSRVPKRTIGSGLHLASEPMVLIAIDMISCNINGKQTRLLTIIDYATRFPIAVECPQMDTTSVWRLIYNNWISYFGCPLYLLSDNGPPFSSTRFDEYLRNHGIEGLKSTVYYPQGNAVIEAFHQFLRRGINIQTRINPDAPIEDTLATLLYHYRATPTIAIRESPFFMLTGLDMVRPGLQAYTMITDLHRKQQLELLLEIRADLMDTLIRNIALRPYKESKEVRVNDLVIYELNATELQRFNKTYVKGKSLPRWSEPMRVVEVLANGQKLRLKSIWNEKGMKEVSRQQVTIVKNSEDELILPWKELEIKHARRQKAGILPVSDSTKGCTNPIQPNEDDENEIFIELPGEKNGGPVETPNDH